MGKVYKVYCEYYVKAKDREEAEEFVRNEQLDDYVERHIIVEETSEVKKEEDWEQEDFEKGIKDKRKIHIDDLYEKAQEWWDNIPVDDIGRNTEIIVTAYMKNKGIKEEDVAY